MFLEVPVRSGSVLDDVHGALELFHVPFDCAFFVALVEIALVDLNRWTNGAIRRASAHGWKTPAQPLRSDRRHWREEVDAIVDGSWGRLAIEI